MTEYGTRIERLQRQPIISIRGKVSHEGAVEFFDRGFARLFEHLNARGGRLAGAPLSCTHANTEAGMDIEIALPLESPVEGDGDIVAGEVPDVEAAVGTHVGSYGELGASYSALMTYARQQGRQPTGVGYEFYVDDPREVPAEERRTVIALPLLEAPLAG
ncbi:MAG TPA: GyrI-like domain-containing protein [Longimicrobiales bacterium]|nr:GyrI-like domain-containing protein [Longimicrobiales bacterium]